MMRRFLCLYPRDQLVYPPGAGLRLSQLRLAGPSRSRACPRAARAILVAYSPLWRSRRAIASPIPRATKMVHCTIRFHHFMTARWLGLHRRPPAILAHISQIPQNVHQVPWPYRHNRPI